MHVIIARVLLLGMSYACTLDQLKTGTAETTLATVPATAGSVSTFNILGLNKLINEGVPVLTFMSKELPLRAIIVCNNQVSRA